MPDEVIDQVMAGGDSGGLQLLGPDGVLAELTKRLLDRAMDEELTDHLGYERATPPAAGRATTATARRPRRF